MLILISTTLSGRFTYTMQIITNLLRVIFMLSTIVYVTDCCSSRILLLEEHTLKFVRQRYQQYQHQNQQQQQHQQSQEYASSLANSRSKFPPKNKQQVDLNVHIKHGESKKNISSSPELKEYVAEEDKEEDENSTIGVVKNMNDTTDTPFEQPLPMEEAVEEASIVFFISTESTATDHYDQSDVDTLNTGMDDIPIALNTSDLTPAPSTREQNAGNSNKYHVVDLYYTIMRDVLSYECFGQYLTDFCLNGGRCFRYPIGNHSFYSCECADDYVGERCESKSINELYIPSSTVLAKDAVQPKILMARFVFSYPSLLVISTIYILIAAILVYKKRASGMLVVGQIDYLDSM